MRVSEDGRVEAQRRDEGRRCDFEATLRQVEGRQAEAVREGHRREALGRDELARAAQHADQQQAARRAAEADGYSANEQGGVPEDREGPASARPGREAGHAAGGGNSSPDSGPGPGVAGGGAAATASAAPRVEQALLARAVRALPPVIETFQASGQVALSLDFGGALGVELRRAAGGVEVTLSAPPALRPAARAELAGLCRTLAARGVTVASAEVKGVTPDQGPRR